MTNEEKTCEHKYVHLETKRSTTYSGYNTKFTRIDFFFCEKCLEKNEKRQVEYSRDTPDWF